MAKEKEFSVTPTGAGLPDYSAPAPVGQLPKPTTYTLSDMAELAARLGSICTYDRRGDVIWLDDFECINIRWNSATSGAGSSVSLSNAASRSGEQSVAISGGTEIDGAALIERYLQIPVLSRIGFEISFTVPKVDSYMLLRLYIFDGEMLHEMYVYYQRSSHGLYLVEPAGVVRLLDTVSLFERSSCFHTIKLVGDYTTDKYIRCCLNNREYDISSYTIIESADTRAPQLCMEVRVENDEAGSNPCYYMDDFILTQNEP